jgi:lysophospholipase L1-like esterase
LALLLVVITLSVVLLTGEIVLRLLGYHGAPQSILRNIYQVDDAMLDWRYIPHSTFKSGRVVHLYNGAGFRDVEHAMEKPPGIKRLIVVGDSVTEGHGVKTESVFSRLLQSQLGGAYEVITMAMGGLNTPQEIRLFEKAGLVYTGDLVILNFVLNDCDHDATFKRAQEHFYKQDAELGMLNMSINPRFKRLLLSSAMLYLIKERVQYLQGRFLGQEQVDYFVKIWAQAENRQRVTEALDTLQTLHQAHHFDVLVIIWPVLMDYRHYKFAYIHTWMQEQAAQRDFATLDLLPSFSKSSFRDLQVAAEDNIHPNALGHKVAVEAFLHWYGVPK